MSYEIKFLQEEVKHLKKDYAALKKLLEQVLENKTTQKPVDENYYTIKQVAEKLSTSKRTVSRMIQNNELIVVTRNNSESGTKKIIRIPASSLQQWTSQNQTSIN